MFNNSSAHALIQWLRSRCFPDPEFPVGEVSSIYYDTWDWRFLHEKVNSDYLKTKVRVRWYSDINTKEPENHSYLEAKQKIGGRREKIRVKTEFNGRWLSRVNLESQELKTIPRLLLSEGVVIQEQLYPVFQISFKRRRFIEPITLSRLCIDFDIRAPRINYQMLPFFYPFQLQTAVFELKGKATELPDELHQLTALGCCKRSYSKYYACYRKIMQAEF
ncbi:VTC domain-containing protein [Acidobacteriota bacterium]